MGEVFSPTSTEQTCLLAGVRPSACSTNEKTATTTNGGSYDDYDGETGMQRSLLLPPARGSHGYQHTILDEDHPVKPSLFHQSRCFHKFKWGMAIMILLGGISVAFVATYLRSHSGPSSSSSTSTVSPPTKLIMKSFSKLHPVHDLGLMDYDRPHGSKPQVVLTHRFFSENRTMATTSNQTTTMTPPRNRAYPTNAWYQNMIIVPLHERPALYNRAYALPYVVDAAGSIPGLRIHPNHLDASNTGVQLSFVDIYGLTLGAATSTDIFHHPMEDELYRYTVLHTTHLGITLGWESLSMQSSIVRGMPYATMQYMDWRNSDATPMESSTKTSRIYPTIASEISVAKTPLGDGETPIPCSSNTDPANAVRVEREIELFFKTSDFTWLVFLSEPVMVLCIVDDKSETTHLQIVDFATPPPTTTTETSVDQTPLTIRVALWKPCTSGSDPIYCHQEEMHPTALHIGQGKYHEILSQHASTYPGPNTSFSYTTNEDDGSIDILFDWDVQHFNTGNESGPHNETDLIMFALAHHFDMIAGNSTGGELYCAPSLLGPACLYAASTWKLEERRAPVSLRAGRHPDPEFISLISESLQKDLTFKLPKIYRHGAGDTYFSGKMLAKLGRILLIAEELREICDAESSNLIYTEVCKGLILPTDTDMETAIGELRQSVQVWIDGTSQIPFVFDPAWGGIIYCGCNYYNGKCVNKFPDCPAFGDPGLNFGNAYYNDMHFHYGYHIFAAAVVAHFDPEWGRTYFENVLLLVRNIANPDDEDEFFTTWRHKDWFQGNSWASGIAVTPLNGRNQESSSEAIAAYEAVALYGSVMRSAWKEVDSVKGVAAAKCVEDAGQVLLATEIRATHKYWHIERKENSVKIFPSAYKPFVIGIMWQTMAQFQTWFGGAAYLAYGIQLLPFTPISEQRDSIDWSKVMYGPFADSCEADDRCMESGWRILQLGMMATIGHKSEAIRQTLKLNAGVFTDPGGNGHSLSNTLWYIATRPKIDKPLPLPSGDGGDESSDGHCGVPMFCTDYVLDTIADLYSCRQRIKWLRREMGMSEKDACTKVATKDYPLECGACDPSQSSKGSVAPTVPICPPCSTMECESQLNRCPNYDVTFVCTGGPSFGGCSSYPWKLSSTICSSCCEMTHCPPVAPADRHVLPYSVARTSQCPPCTKEECHAPKNRCPKELNAPFVCLEGLNVGGCSPSPWLLGLDCARCCEATADCE